MPFYHHPRPTTFRRYGYWGIVALIVVAVSAFGWWQLRQGVVQPEPMALTNTEPTATPPPEPRTVMLAAVGDIMLSRTVEQKILQRQDWSYPFRETADLTSNADVTFGNLESPLIEGPIVPTGSMVFRGDPRSVAGLELGGFDVLSLANNHLKNQGVDGITTTMTALDEVGIAYVGAGADEASATQPAILTVNGLRLGFLAYLDSAFTPTSYEATADRSGSPFLRIEQMEDDVATLAPSVDVVIVSMHAGNEYANQPNQTQIDFAHAAIDAGAALVIGHHPHVVQPIEWYADGLILYSLGNFVFDQMWSEPTREAAIAMITITETAVTDATLTPIKIYDYAQPRITSTEEGAPILKRMEQFTYQ